jgi:hypothetical protein
MSYEYVRLTDTEVNYTKKHLLNTELEALTSLKKLKQYKKLRNEELAIKVSLKSSLDSLSQQLIILNKLLPHTSWDKKEQEEMKSSITTMNEPETPLFEDKTNNNLENQLEEIRRKLARLQ